MYIKQWMYILLQPFHWPHTTPNQVIQPQDSHEPAVCLDPPLGIADTCNGQKQETSTESSTLEMNSTNQLFMTPTDVSIYQTIGSSCSIVVAPFPLEDKKQMPLYIWSFRNWAYDIRNKLLSYSAMLSFAAVVHQSRTRAWQGECYSSVVLFILCIWNWETSNGLWPKFPFYFLKKKGIKMLR